MKQHTLHVVLPLLADLTDIEAPAPIRSSLPERVISRMAGEAYPSTCFTRRFCYEDPP